MLQFLVKFLIPGCLLLSAAVGAQTAADRLVIERYNTQNGLTHAHVYQVFQDSRGFIWLVTGDALMLYDGNLFLPVIKWEVLNSPYDSQLLFEDDAGKIWIRKGKACYLVDIRSLEVTDLDALLNNRISGQIDCVVKGNNGEVWLIMAANEILRYNVFNRQLSRSGFARPGAELTLGAGNIVWFFNENIQLEDQITHRLDVAGSVLTPVSHTVPGRMKILSGGRLGGINEEGLVLVNPDNSIYRFKISGHRDIYKINIALVGCTLPAPAEENGKYCWVYLQGELLRINVLDNTVDNFTELYGLPNLPMVFDVLKDRSGIYWIATGDGLVKVSRIPQRFNRYVWQNLEITRSAPKNSCRGISQAQNGDIYLSYSGELHKKGISEPDFQRQTTTGVTILAVQAALDSTSVWLGSGYLLKFDSQSKLVTVLERPELVKLGDLWSIYEEKDVIWLGYSTEPLIFDKKTNRIRTYYSPDTPGLLRNTEIYQITPTPGHDSLWMATNKGLFLLDKERKVVAHYHTGSSSRLPCDNIRHINQTAPNQIWMATSCGLVSWQPRSGTVGLVSTQEGLPNAILYAVYPDEYGFLWMSSNMGIIQYHIQSGRVRHFTTRDGVSSNEFNRISHLQADDGTLFFGSINGVTALHPGEFSSDFFEGSSAGLVLIRAQAQGVKPGETVDLLPYYLKNGIIQVKPDERFIKLHFALPNYSVTGTVTYYYKIEGVNDTWQQVNSPDIMFPQLPGGKYKIYIRTGSMSGASSVVPVILEMEVLPHFYEEPWFFILIFVLLVALGTIAWRIRVKYLLERQRELETKIQEATSQIMADKKLIEAQMNRIANISEEKNRFFVNITHELRTPLTLVTAPLEELQSRRLLPKKESGLLATAARNAQQLLVLVNDLLMLAKDEIINRFDPDQSVSLVPLLEEIIQLHSFGAAQKGVRFHFVRGTSEHPEVAGDEKLIRRALGNIVANAVKFSDKAGRITISVSHHADLVTVSVADTGRGIEAVDLPHIFERFYQTQRTDMPLEGGTGIGLSITREIMDTLHGNIWVESEPGRGSTFRLDFPVAKSTDVQAVQPVAVTYETINLKSGRRKHIFLVDDNPEIGGFLADILERDFEISTFFTAESVLSSLRHHPVPDLLICDLMMPAMNGFELIGEIRRTPAYGNMKILVLTAMTAPDVGDRARAIGADDIIWKPFTRDALEQKILKLVSETASSGPPGDYINALIPARDLSEEQLAWLSRLNGLVAMHISDPGFSVDGLAASMFISRITLFREMDKLTGMTPNEYIQGFRLEYARKLLESGKANSIAGVLDEIGLRNKPYFARIYKARFGKAPHTYFNGLSE